jgi:hypothetical protein
MRNYLSKHIFYIQGYSFSTNKFLIIPSLQIFNNCKLDNYVNTLMACLEMKFICPTFKALIKLVNSNGTVASVIINSNKY